MTADPPRLERFDDHRYLVSVGEGDELVEVRFYAAPALVDRIGAQVPDDHIIRAATEFLLDRQRADDLPDSVDLDVVAATYPDFVDDIRRRVSSG